MTKPEKPDFIEVRCVEVLRVVEPEALDIGLFGIGRRFPVCLGKGKAHKKARRFERTYEFGKTEPLICSVTELVVTNDEDPHDRGRRPVGITTGSRTGAMGRVTGHEETPSIYGKMAR